MSRIVCKAACLDQAQYWLQILRLAPSTGQAVGEPTTLHGGVMLMRVTADGHSLALGTRRGEVVWLRPALPDPITLARRNVLTKCTASGENDGDGEVAQLYGTIWCAPAAAFAKWTIKRVGRR